MQRIPTGLFAAAIIIAVAIGFASADDQAPVKHTIKQVMKGAHKEGLLKKVAAGNGNDYDKQELLDLYISLAQNEPPKGELDNWRTLTTNIVVAAAKVVVGRDGAGEELTQATKCGTCHKPHKG